MSRSRKNRLSHPVFSDVATSLGAAYCTAAQAGRQCWMSCGGIMVELRCAAVAPRLGWRVGVRLVTGVPGLAG